MELNFFNPKYGDNIVAINLNKIDYDLLENCKNWIKKQTPYIIFSTW
jgi:hypothetical protein